ncbi:MAG: DUF6268 family outer membrane beta-barrel protein [Planctomycetaceae bacterium]
MRSTFACLSSLLMVPALCVAQEHSASGHDLLTVVSHTAESDTAQAFDSVDSAVSRTTVFDNDIPVSRFRKQAIQKFSVSGGWLVAANGNDLNNSFLEGSVGLAVPLGSFDNVLGVTPYFRTDWMDASGAIEIPNELFDTGVRLFWKKPVNDRLSITAVVSPSVRSDFTTGDGAIRIFGMGLLTWQKAPDRPALSMGVVYLDRPDIPILPAVGLSWTPNPHTKLDIRFPESRISRRIEKHGSQDETWAYLSGGFGGNTWAVSRVSGANDQLSLRYLNLMIGLETIFDGGTGWFAEAGIAFDRQLEYESTTTEVPLSNALMLQAGWSW